IQVFGFAPDGTRSILASFFALGFNPANQTNNLQMLGAGGFNGVGGVAFGAPSLTNGQEILVSSSRGSPLVIDVWSLDRATGGVQKAPHDLFFDLTDVSNGGIPIDDPMTGQPISASQLFDGATVAGFMAAPKVS